VNDNDSDHLKVSQNYPNPFSEVTCIKVDLESPGPLRLEVWDITGQQVKDIDKGYVYAGVHRFTVTRDNLSSGIYFYTVRKGSGSFTGKMTVM
jgi:hypothetical protein